ncbi:hypothetical protein INT44_007018 [Umbelopsis vinacea]|uniref:Uncharacterized protein n=1 Tax=Umbelopsis vinacea TaxID=44442 RepID=A0A8H7U8C3_9FUNG|nr:hypothetical protein INT44_007018 [Umbelopsis vinacea]
MPNDDSHHPNNQQPKPKAPDMEKLLSRQQSIHTHSMPRHHRGIMRTPPLAAGNDQAFIEFSRCLYQAKTIVKELQAFSANVSPSLRMSMLRQNNLTHGQDNQKDTAEQFLNSIRHYLDTTFEKFTRLCKVLLFVLTKMESSGSVRIERITSFRRDVWDAWKVANDIKARLTALIEQESLFLNYGDHATPLSMASNMPPPSPSVGEPSTPDIGSMGIPSNYSQRSPSLASSPCSPASYNFS